jgi:mannose-1-phosphate guanylyltransferase
MVLPADHLVGDLSRYEELVTAAEAYAGRNDCLLTFGIQPSRPETGYGYVQAGRSIEAGPGVELYSVDAFHEKPTLERAKRFLKLGTYFWNSGMFLWKPGVILAAIQKHLPELHEVLAALQERVGTDQFESVFKSTYPRVPSISIDYGVMEKADNVVVLKSDFYWNDIGSWESVREAYEADADDNVLVGEHVMIDSSGNTVFSPERCVGIVGMSGVVVVDSGDAILVCKRERAQQVRDIVKILKKKRRKELL